ncbi:NAD-dependent protein deacylase-like isoform X2 [Cimex lectularius]|uniref:NAD-dependent protein deacylase n=1 Tax=Cimex lectularius TaxID=79782 RepID=A0A8I6SNK3_CIMLE|nr:NAD-dependent protein deacylase-like isoform X2 [Cimex lectularius]
MAATSLAEYLKLRPILAQARNIIVLTGAGTSAESGIPTFRGAGGFWRTYQSQDLATYNAFKRSPSLVWEFYHYRRELVLTKKPNKAHYAIAEAESLLKNVGRKMTVITQNIDGLHQRAGSQDVIELHGSLFKTRCIKCENVTSNFDSPICAALEGLGAPDPNVKSSPIPEEQLPRCKIETCKGLLRPHIVWFGENLEEKVIDATENALKECDACLIIGSSSVVYPAAMYAPALAARNIPVAEFNIESTPVTSNFQFHFKGPCTETVPEALKYIVNSCTPLVYSQSQIGKMHYSTSTDKNSDVKLSKRQKFVNFIKQYGPIAVAVHIGHSLIILGGLYTALYCGLDVVWALEKVGLADKSDILKKGGTFVVAYAISKVLSPVRFAITFAITPPIARYLIKTGLIKKSRC